MYDIHSDIKEITNKIERIVCERYNCDVRDIFGYSKKDNLPIARSILYLFLHDYIGVSTAKIAKAYNRAEISIWQQNSKSRGLVKYDYNYRTSFNSIKHIYEKGE
jgi:chromosomal replication initiation ATPase DnaA